MFKFLKDGYTYKAGDLCQIVEVLTKKDYVKLQYFHLEGHLTTGVFHSSEMEEV